MTKENTHTSSAPGALHSGSESGGRKEEFLSELAGTLSKVTTIEGAWTLYVAACFPKGMGDLQHEESRKVFYAACDWVLKRLIAESAKPDDEAADLLSNLLDQIQQFVVATKATGGMGS